MNDDPTVPSSTPPPTTPPFARQRRITLRSTDAAGVLFFAEQLALVHEVYEELLEQLGTPLRAILEARSFGLPIVRAETELLAPLRVGDVVDIGLRVERIGSTSFTLAHELHRGRLGAEGPRGTSSPKHVGAGRTVHVCIDVATGTPRPLPAELAAGLRALAP